MCISFNGTLIKSKETCISPESEAFLYGYGIFETLKIHCGKIFFIDEHLERLKKGCKELNIKLDYDLKKIQKYCYNLINSNSMVFGALKILYAKNKDQYNLLLFTRENIYTEEKYKKGFHICFADTKKNPYSKLTYIKSNNYLENILEKQKAKENGYDEAIFLNVLNKISEGTYTNIFFIKNNILYTPATECGILPGIMRNKIIDLIYKLNLNLKIGTFNKADLFNADEIFLTNSLMDIMPVSQLENKVFDLSKNYVTKLLQKSFYNLYYHQ
ncbi:4-amino-4-deoxychorismate lyase [Crassaminicella thermophila]|uniref:4-amino-4-deoxychorismate lyase n=1 Tax=Crassaminicella thermophila TaxID=2599308 RepID=A0A5C0SAJ0_CRATE|nr:aminotransferase class IV [Crassaminicella thermophila]QEK11030.1 4-amino-4-deoxychorismate lyase [Crassaminicella thermophila]